MKGLLYEGQLTGLHCRHRQDQDDLVVEVDLAMAAQGKLHTLKGEVGVSSHANRFQCRHMTGGSPLPCLHCTAMPAAPIPSNRLAPLAEQPVPAPPRVLLVEDDLELATMVTTLLTRDGFAAQHESSLASARSRLAASAPDVLVLDLMLPDGSGLDFCRGVRAEGQDVPILMLTARGDPFDRVLGLELGADDYLGKPFEPRELVARLRALLRRRRAPGPAHCRRYGELEIDQLARRASWAGRDLLLSTLEFKLLVALASRAGEAVGRAELSATIQPGSYLPLERAVDVQVARLRRKLRDAAPGAEDLIETVRGEGYVLTVLPTDGRGPA